MSRWFRLYADVMRNPKVARLSDADFRLWIKLLTVAAENDGAIPPTCDLKHLLNARLDHLSKALDRLISGGLIDALEQGYEPHNWGKFQYKSDTSTERVHKHREKRNVSETPPETETDTEVTVAKATVPRERSKLAERPSDVSDAVWQDFKILRKDKRAALTDTALAQIRKQAIEVGWSLEAALTECCARGWQGFKADWIKEGNGRNGQRNGNSTPGIGPTERAALSFLGIDPREAARSQTASDRSGGNGGYPSPAGPCIEN